MDQDLDLAPLIDTIGMPNATKTLDVVAVADPSRGHRHVAQDRADIDVTVAIDVDVTVATVDADPGQIRAVARHRLITAA